MKEAIDIIDYMRELPDEMKTEAVCWHALRQNWYALRHIPHDLQTKEMQIYALKQSPDALFCIKGEVWDELIEIINEGGYGVSVLYIAIMLKVFWLKL